MSAVRGLLVDNHRKDSHIVTGRLIAIGDIHGCLTALNRLLDAIDPQPDDTFVLLGDYLDRGPDSRGVIDRILQLGEESRMHAILGNHEEMLLAVLDGSMSPHFWIRHGGTATLDSYGFAGDLNVIPPRHIEFVRSCPALIETESYFFTHGNYDAEIALTDQDPAMLRWTSLHEHSPEPHQSGKKAIVGHTASRSGEIVDLGHLKCIDTYCYGGQWLTALDIREGTVWQANQEGELRQ